MNNTIIKHLNRIPMERHSWLLIAGPIAKRLNREAQLENERRTVSGVEEK